MSEITLLAAIENLKIRYNPDSISKKQCDGFFLSFVQATLSYQVS